MINAVLDMGCDPLFQHVKFYIKRLILVVGVVFSVVLVLQSSSLPYGNLLSSLLNFKPVMISHSKSVNGSCCTDSPAANSSEGINVWEVIQPDSVSVVGKDQMSNSEPFSEKQGHYSVVEAQKADNEDSKLILGNVSSVETGLISQSLAPPPLDVTGDLNSSSQSGANSSKDDVSSFITKATETLSKSNNSVPLQIDAANSTKNSAITTKTVKKKRGKLLPTTISEMTNILLQNRVSSHAMRPRWSSVLDQELLFAKSQIEGAPLLKSSAELYPPLYRNISKFKRSYELMENTLKVYIYNEGEKPIFHQPKLKGIYASESWFMKLMEGNKQFVVKDPTKAHIFYLPFSAYRLRLAFYDQRPKGLTGFLKNYVDIIAGKYPFWNRTGGSDHFLVACHDWAPQETIKYMGNCIRALCNSDVASGFIIGKDVSLPVTNVLYVDDPLRGLGGKPPSKRPFLAFFAGSMHGKLREILLQYWENKDPDMKIFGPLPQSEKLNYRQYMKSSKYCICARGYEVHTPRVVEAIFHECVPVILSDNYVPPFFEVLNWEAFSVFVLQKDVPNLKNILLSIPRKRYLELQKRVKKVQKHFLWHNNPVKHDIFHMTLHSIWYNRIFQIKPR